MTTPNELLVLGREELGTLAIGWVDVVDVLEDAFAQKARGLVQNPPKPAIRPLPDAFINAMPAYLGGSDRAGIKWVAGFEQNRSKGLPYIFGVFVLTDADTGRPLALMDGGWITEMGTAGVSGVVLRIDPVRVRTVAVVGAGMQGRRHLELLLELYPEVEEVRVFDAEAAASLALVGSVAGRRGTVASSPQDAVTGSDVVITAVTVTLDPRLTCAEAADDALVLPVDYDDAVGPAAVGDASLYVVDDLGQYDAVEHFDGFRRPDGELADVVARSLAVPTAGRRVFLNLGIAMDDVALGSLCYERALERGVGRRIAFP